jgi:hypothetical protein
MPNTLIHIIYHGKAAGRDKSGKKIWTKIDAVWASKSGKGSTITLEYHPLTEGITIMLPYAKKLPDDLQLIPDEGSA